MNRVACYGLLITLLSAAPIEAASLAERATDLLARRCLSCHQAGEAKGGLALDTRAASLTGGEGGPAVVSGDAAASLLLDYVSGDAPTMPKTGAKLTVDEVALLREWIGAGAPWTSQETLQERPAASLDWWSLRPLSRPAVPLVADGEGLRSPVDPFVRAKLQQEGLTPSEEADRRTLIRRLSFDLLGLPPTPEEIAEFEADPAPDAYERLVDRLLASPHHGERWARHWLDVVHYGETHGYDKDQPRPNAWPYRDYVIAAFNDDKPYAQFVREQLAGDVIAPDSAEGTTALGFIAAGPWDLIGHAEVPETKTDGKIARNLDRDDMVVNTFNTFCSTTVQCARCHAHKFDPVSQIDYYRLQAVFAALDRAEAGYDVDPQIGKSRRTLLVRQRESETRIAELDAQINELAGPEWRDLQEHLRVLSQQEQAGVQTPPEHGYHSLIAATPEEAKWVQIDLGQPVAMKQIVLQPCFDDFNQIGAGFGFPVRFRIDVSNDAEFGRGTQTFVDLTGADVPNPGVARRAWTGEAQARYVRITATKLAPRLNDFIFALAEVEVLDAAGMNVARHAAVTSLDSIEAPERWRRTNLVDGLFPHGSTADILASRQRWTAQAQTLLASRVPAEVLATQAARREELRQLQAQLDGLPAQQRAYIGKIHFGSGTFLGTGPGGGRPRPIHVLARGDVNSPREQVEPGAPAFVPGRSDVFSVPVDGPESARRLALADWIVDQRHPLTWRTIVNRVWQYHFGRGIVDSPNDFGRMGQLPTHPELLDWLAVEFRDGPQSLKAMHRLLVSSATYRQVSVVRPDAAAQDAGNSLLWRANRRKLDAESVRDSLLSVSGLLNTAMGGPSFQDFVIERPEHSPHYEYRLHDPRDVRSHRRSVYRFLVRSQPQPFMTTLDCADPSMSVDKRNESLNALQALALLNNGLTLVASQEFAARLERDLLQDTSPDRQRHQVAAAFTQALGRVPAPDELATLATYAQEFGLANACRVILNLNEFAFVD